MCVWVRCFSDGKGFVAFLVVGCGQRYVKLKWDWRRMKRSEIVAWLGLRVDREQPKWMRILGPMVLCTAGLVGSAFFGVAGLAAGVVVAAVIMTVVTWRV